MTIGHIKLDRRILNWEWYQDDNVFRLFLHLLLTANFKDCKWQGNDVKRGQVITGINSLSKKTGLSNQQIRTCFTKLQKTGEITIKPTNKYSLITICKYDVYQYGKNEINKQTNTEITSKSTNNQQTINKQSTTSKEGKEDKEGKESLKGGKNNFSEKGISSMPTASDFNSLPEQYKSIAIEKFFFAKQLKINEDTVKSFWNIFKTQNLTGKDYYANEGKVYNHFCNWIVKQNISNIPSTKPKMEM